MKTIFVILFLSGIIFLIQSCSEQITDKSLITNSINVNNASLFKCCNLGRPEECSENEKRSLLTDIGDIIISCECCQEVWDYYGGVLPPGNEIPHTILGVYVCIPHEKEDDHD